MKTHKIEEVFKNQPCMEIKCTEWASKISEVVDEVATKEEDSEVDTTHVEEEVQDHKADMEVDKVSTVAEVKTTKL